MALLMFEKSSNMSNEMVKNKGGKGQIAIRYIHFKILHFLFLE